MPGPEGKFRSQRHPLCPECKYDLIATVESRRRTCPECGYEFEMDELSGEKRPGDWTVGRGFRLALQHLLLRGLVIVPLWAGCIWLLSNWFQQYSGCLSALLLVAAGMGIAQGCTVRLADAAGFSSLLLLLLAGAAVLLFIIAGIGLVNVFTPVPGIAWVFYFLIAGFPALAWVLKVIVLDD